MPSCFEAYADLRLVLDYTEIQVNKSHCLSCRLLTYSHYKRKHTVKAMIGVSPAVLITFVSDSFGGRASDKACFEASGITGKLESLKDDIMVDKGFNVRAICDSRRLGLVQPAFLRKQEQFSATDSRGTAKIHEQECMWNEQYRDSKYSKRSRVPYHGRC